MKQSKKRLFSGLVSLRPFKETAGKTSETVKGEISGLNPSVVVPQEDNATADRINTLRLFDAALTPSDMAGSYGIPPWALDTARLVRARTWAKKAGMLPHIESPDTESFTVSLQGLRWDNATFANATISRASILHDLPCDIDSRSIETWDETVEYATELANEAARENRPPPPQGGQGGRGNPGKSPKPSEGEGEGEGEPGEPSEGNGEGKLPKPGEYRLPDQQPKKTPAPVPRSLETGRPIPEEELEIADPWPQGTTPPPNVSGKRQTGHCENFHKPDEVPMRPRVRKKGMRRRSTNEGTVMGRVNRLFTDGKMFKSGIIRGGYRGRGSIMVDLSGSMCWTEADIAATVEALPECSVFGYCGSAQRGRIVLLADRGKTAKPEAITLWKNKHGLSGGNEIDDSALRFLCRQAPPRLWISDGGVCACGCTDEWMQAECDKAIKCGRIIRVRTGVEAAKIILGRKG